MNQRMKVTLVAIALVAVIAVGVVVTNPILGKGLLRLQPQVGQTGSVKCPGTWTEVFKLKGDGTTPSQIISGSFRNVETGVQKGCDFKVRLGHEFGSLGAAAMTLVCDNMRISRTDFKTITCESPLVIYNVQGSVNNVAGYYLTYQEKNNKSDFSLTAIFGNGGPDAVLSENDGYLTFFYK